MTKSIDTSPAALRALANAWKRCYPSLESVDNLGDVLRVVADEKESENFNKQELAEILREASTIIHALILLPGDPIDIRFPIVDELTGFACMLEAAPEGPKT